MRQEDILHWILSYFFKVRSANKLLFMSSGNIPTQGFQPPDATNDPRQSLIHSWMQYWSNLECNIECDLESILQTIYWQRHSWCAANWRQCNEAAIQETRNEFFYFNIIFAPFPMNTVSLRWFKLAIRFEFPKSDNPKLAKESNVRRQYAKFKSAHYTAGNQSFQSN